MNLILTFRGPSEADQYCEERVLEVRRDANRSAHIALVAGAEGKRWILATENMKYPATSSLLMH